MLGLLRKLLLPLFVQKSSRDRVASGRARGRGAPVSREQLIKDALMVRKQKEHIWEDLSDEERARMLEQLGDGMAAQIEQMKGGSD